MQYMTYLNTEYPDTAQEMPGNNDEWVRLRSTLQAEIIEKHIELFSINSSTLLPLWRAKHSVLERSTSKLDQFDEDLKNLNNSYYKEKEKRIEAEIAFKQEREKREAAEIAYRRAKEKRIEAEDAYSRKSEQYRKLKSLVKKSTAMFDRGGSES